MAEVETLQEAREKVGSTQEHMAHELGVSRPTYCKIEKEPANAGVLQTRRICKILSRSYECFSVGTGDTRKRSIGTRYAGVQAKINASLGASAAKAYTAKSGNILSGIAAKYVTACQVLAAKNGISSPNVIYPGQVLKV